MLRALQAFEMTADLEGPPGGRGWTQPDDLSWDPFDRELHRDGFPVWKRMRDEAPLYYNEPYDFYALSRFDDVLSTYVDWKTYSSARGDILEIIRADRGEHQSAIMISEDPPLQHLHRSTVNRAFTPRAVEIVGDRVRGIAARALDEMRDAGGFDMVRDLGGRVSGTAIGGMLGVPDEELPMLQGLIDAVLGNFQPSEDGSLDRWREASERQAEYFLEQARKRREDPTDDIVSVLATMEFTDEHENTRRLNDAEVVGNLTLLAAGGYETMARFAGWMGAVLTEHPDQRAKLVEQPELITNAVEELLRFQPPSHANARLSLEDVEWYGRTVPAGSVFLLIPAAAGRDERQYPDPDRFDVERRFERHVAFGFGIHYCLGAPLAKLEGRIIMEEMLKRIPEWDVDWDDAEIAHYGSAVRGYAKLPITF